VDNFHTTSTFYNVEFLACTTCTFLKVNSKVSTVDNTVKIILTENDNYHSVPLESEG